MSGSRSLIVGLTIALAAAAAGPAAAENVLRWAGSTPTLKWCPGWPPVGC
jgi:hypothetical protein